MYKSVLQKISKFRGNVKSDQVRQMNINRLIIQIWWVFKYEVPMNFLSKERTYISNTFLELKSKIGPNELD